MCTPGPLRSGRETRASLRAASQCFSVRAGAPVGYDALMRDTEVTTHPSPASEAAVAMCVLASGSKGNCTVLRMRTPEGVRLVLIDAGLTPKRTGALLEPLGAAVAQIDEIVFSHLDTDHCCATWTSAMPLHARFRIHRRHRGAAHRMGLTVRRTELFDDDPFEAPHTLRAGGLRFAPITLSHDDHGVAAFRIESPCGRSLGFATDLGRATEALVRHLEGVDVLAIESNYCPRMQRASGRPVALQNRIMGGAGHLSNEQCAEAVRRIAPREAVVLLHLSQQCNEPARASLGHEGAPYAVTISSQDGPTGWIPIVSEWPTPRKAPREVPREAPLTVEVCGAPDQRQGALFVS